MLARILLITVLSSLCIAGLQEGITALNRGDYEEAYKHFLPLAEAGDDNAMITIGLMYHEGQGVEQDYAQAMDWYIKAFKERNGDAYSNIGVMYRDGLGVEKNRKMAYCLFLITHACGLGTESTQYRANSCLRRIITEMPHEEFVECFDYTQEFIEAYVLSKGTLKGIPENCKPSEGRLSLKDKPWWLEGELDFLKTENDQTNDISKDDNTESGKLTRELHSIKIRVPSIQEIGNISIESPEYAFTTNQFDMMSKGNGMESIGVSLNGPVPAQITAGVQYGGKKYNGSYQLDPNILNVHSLYEVIFTLNDSKLVSSCRVSSLKSPQKAYGSISETEWYFDESGHVTSVDKCHMAGSHRVSQKYIIENSGIHLYSLYANVKKDVHVWYYLDENQIINKIRMIVYGQNEIDHEISYDKHGKIVFCMAHNEKTKKYDIPTENKLFAELPEIKSSFKDYYREYDIEQIAAQDGILLPRQ